MFFSIEIVYPYGVTDSTTPVSRRDRPAKPPLSREWIVDATLEIARREGLAKATMRRVAQELDTGPASLYVYVANTAELHGAVLDQLLGALKLTRRGDYLERTETLLRDYHDLLVAYPGLARSALVMRPAGPNWLRLFDAVLGLLIEGGLESDRASWGTDALLLHVTAIAAEHSTPAAADPDAAVDPGRKITEIEQATRGSDPATTPHVAAHSAEILGGTGGARWTWTIRAMIAGFAATAIETLDRPASVR
jgi:AcrR family transcriptional regulator